MTEKRAQIHLCKVKQCHEATHRFTYEDTATDASPPSKITRLDYGIVVAEIEWGVSVVYHGLYSRTAFPSAHEGTEKGGFGCSGRTNRAKPGLLIVTAAGG